MSPAPPGACPACGAPLPAPAGGVRVRCGWCGADARLGAAPATRRLLLADEGDRAEAAALLGQHLASRFRAPATLRGGGESRWAPFWSVVTAEGELLAGPATREEQPLLRRVTLPALPARPLADAEAPPAGACAQDLPLDEFLASLPGRADAAPPALERAWLVWVPVRFWQVRIGNRATRAVTVADLTQPVLAPLPEAEPPARLRPAVLAPLAALTACLLLLGRLLPLARPGRGAGRRGRRPAPGAGRSGATVVTPATPEPTGLPTLSCPGCGGQTRPGPGGRFDCLYCGGRFLAAGDPGVPTLTPRRHLGAATAFHAARDWLREQEIAADPPPRAGAVSLLFVPFWRYAALLSGWVLTRPERAPAAAPPPGRAARDPAAATPLVDLLARSGRRDEEARLAAFLAAPRAAAPGAGEGGAAAHPEPRTSALLKPVAWSGPACDVREFGLVGVHQLVDEAQLVPFDFAAAESAGAVCQVHGSLAAVRRQAERAVLNQLGGSQRVLRRRASFVREQVALIYYPLHVFKYAARGLRCRLVLDGVRGHVLAGTRPAATEDGAWRLLGGLSLWSCVWAASPTGGLGSLPLLWLIDARARDAFASPRALALRAQETLAPPRRIVESF